jgi:hypothetical protein
MLCRYHKSVSVSDLYKMKDVVEILDRGGAGRLVRLARGVCPTPSPTPEDLITDPGQVVNGHCCALFTTVTLFTFDGHDAGNGKCDSCLTAKELKNIVKLK